MCFISASRLLEIPFWVLMLGVLTRGEEDNVSVKADGRTDVIVDCHPQPSSSQTKCEQRGCVYFERDTGPWCTFPAGYGYLQVGDVQSNPDGFSLSLQRMSNPGGFYGTDIESLSFEVQYQTDSRLRILIRDNTGAQFRVPEEALSIDNPMSSTDNTRLYDVIWTNQPQFGFKVIRRSTSAVIFDTTVPGFQYAQQYIQLTTRLNSGMVYGFGEHNHKRFQHDIYWKTWSMFTRDMAPVDAWNLYGQQTFYMNIENSNQANGVVLVNSNAIEVRFQPDPYPGISYRVLGGVLDFYIFLGPSPEEVVQQYTKATGRSYMPPYWGLGFQLGRWGYNSLDNMRAVFERNVNNNMSFDVQYGDIDMMAGKLDFTVDLTTFNGLDDFVDELHTQGYRFIPIQDHCICSDSDVHNTYLPGGYYKAFAEGVQDDIYIKDARNGQPLEGEVWPGLVYYPDYSKPETITWWRNQCYDFYYNQTWRIQYDGLCIDMNEPSNFVAGSSTGCENNDLNCPPYAPKSLAISNNCIYEKTVCMDAQTHWGLHYDTHSLYGHAMAIASWNALRDLFPEKRPVVLTRSQFIGSQKYTQHWLGDNQAFWSNIKWSLVGMLEYSLFGFTYTGSNICGYSNNATEEMCQRWHQVGAFYPFSRNHNGEGLPDQDPSSPLFSENFRTAVRNVLNERYRLLPFLYTLMYQAHTTGSTVVRPLLHEFVNDDITHDIDDQFLWGPSLLISPALNESQTVVRAYIPEGRWYDYFTGTEVTGTNQWHNLDTPLDKINVHLRGGHAIPTQEPAANTALSRSNPMGVVIALGAVPNNDAHGYLFWDDGETYETSESGAYLLVHFHCSRATGTNVCEFTVENNGYPEAGNLQFQTVKVFGLDTSPLTVTVDGAPHTSFIWWNQPQLLEITNLSLVINIDHTLEFAYIFHATV